MTQTEQFSADVAGVEPEGLQLCKFEGKEFRGQRTPIIDGTAMVEDGFALMLDFKLVVRLDQFTSEQRAPAVNEVIEMDGVNYDTKTADTDQYGVAVTYGLKAST